MQPNTDHIVIVGAGVSGLAIARELAPDHNITILDKGGIAADTSSRASGMISLSLEPFPDKWVTFALKQFRSLDGQGVFSFTERETVRLVPQENANYYTKHAPDGATFLSRDELSDRYAETFDDLSAYSGGLKYTRTGFLDALDYAMTLKWTAEQEGARIYRDHEVVGIQTTDGAVTGVETTYGSIDADYVVVATGWKTRELVADYVELPVRPLRWNALVIEPESLLPDKCPMGSEPTMRVYWRPTRHGNVLIGGNEHLLDEPEETPMNVQPEFRSLVRENVAPLLHGVVSGTVRREDCCPTADSASPDGLPIIDVPSEAPDGLAVVTGLHGRGVMLSPVTGRAVRSLITGEESPFALAEFRLDRFDDRTSDFEYQSHWD